MNFPYQSPSWILNSLFVMIPSIALCLGVLWAVRKTFSIHSLKKNHDVAGFTLSIIGVLYSVILGFTVINVQERYNKALETVHTEAMILADLYSDAAVFPSDGKSAIRAQLRQYVDSVLNDEWKVRREKEHGFQRRGAIQSLCQVYYDLSVEGEKMAIWYGQSIEKINGLINVRLTRTFNSWQHLSPMMWTILIAGAIITICFMFFFGLESVHCQMLMTGLLAGYISFMLYLVYSLDHVYQGPEGIRPTALEQVIKQFDEWD